MMTHPIDTGRQDLRYAIRSLLKARGFALVVIVTLGLGIGANTAVFGVLNAAVLRPLPYPAPGQLVRPYLTYNGTNGYFPGPAILDWRDNSRTLDIAILQNYSTQGADIVDHGRAERVSTLEVSADYFRVLDVPPIVGGAFGRDDERADARVAVVSARIWRDYLGGAGAIGKPIVLNGIAHRVVGVMPDVFDNPLVPGVEIWLPLDTRGAAKESWRNNYLSAVARLRPGHTIAEARAELDLLTARERPQFERGTTRTARLLFLQDDIVGTSGQLLWILLGAVGLLLLIACVNVASLFLARGAARRPELAVRAALGCPRWRMIRQFLLESVLLSLAGGGLGLVLARTVSRALLASAPIAIEHGGTFDAAVFAFSFAIATIAGLAFGAAPAVQFTRPDLDAVLREAGRGSGGSRSQTRARNILVVCQVALALVLLIGAGLLLRTFAGLESIALGFRPDNIATFEVHLPEGRYSDSLSRARFQQALEARLAALPGVRHAAATSRLPLTGPYHSWPVQRVEQSPDRQLQAEAQQRVIEGDYFAALGIPLLRGRVFGPEDDDKTPRKIVISQALAASLYRGEEPIGHRLDVGGGPAEIIGIVGDVPIAWRAPAPPTVYHSHRQFAADRNWALTQVVTLDRRSPAFLDAARRELAAIDPALVLYRPRMLTEAMGGGLAQERFALLLIGGFALIAVALAAVGVYGVLSYSVSRRHREIGIRLALGARPSSVRTLVVRDAGVLAAAGIALGLAGAVAATRGIASLLYHVGATDPIVFGSAAALLLSVALAAAWLPAHSAGRVDPLQAFRRE